MAEIDRLSAEYAGKALSLTEALILSTRCGHLTLTAEEGALRALFRQEEIPEMEERIAAILEDAKTFESDALIVREGNQFTLRRYYEKEKAVINTLKNLKPPKDLFQGDFQNPLTIIAGGPGTGKTYTAGRIVRTLLQLSNNTLKVALAAPTGKAAINLQKSFGGEIEARTLHSLLNYNRGQPKPLTCDVLVVDECSMIDLSLMSALTASLKPHSRLILLGDPHQLPPVEAGHIFPTILKECASSVTTLTKCMRTEVSEILNLAEAVKQGHFGALQTSEAITVRSSIDFEELFEQCAAWLHITTPEEAMAQLKRFALLTPLRKGPFGFEQLNQDIFFKLKQLRKDVPVPIMVTANDRKLNLCNGQMGVLFQDGSVVFDEVPLRRLNVSLLPSYEIALCISVHKSQGSEFECVSLLLPEGSEVFGKELVYTGITRAKKRLNLFGLKQGENYVCNNNKGGV